MVATLADERVDNPIYVVMDEVSIGASATVTSASAPCEGRMGATLIYVCDQTHSREIQVSDDDETWYALGTGGSISSSPSGGGLSANVNRALMLPINGARFLRLLLTNGAAVTATATAKVMLR